MLFFWDASTLGWCHNIGFFGFCIATGFGSLDLQKPGLS